MESNLFSSTFDFLKNNIYIILFVIVFIIFIIYFTIYIKNREKPKIVTDIIMDVESDPSILQQPKNNTNLLQQQINNLKILNQRCNNELNRFKTQQKQRPITQPKPQPIQNKNLVRFVRIDRNPQINQPLMLNINEIIIWDENNKIIRDNLKPSLFPQFGNPKQFGPQYLINNVRTSKSGNNWMLPHTTAHMNAFMEIDLSRNRNISFIAVFNRDDCCKDRITRARLVLLDQNRKVISSLPFNRIENAYAFKFSNGVLSYTK